MSIGVYIKNDMWHSTCPLCKSKNIRFLGDIEYFTPIFFSSLNINLDKDAELWSCDSCSSGFTQNSMHQEVAMDLYVKGESGKRWGEGTFKFEQSKMESCVEELSLMLKKDLEILDVGCNTGEFLDFAKEKGCITHGLELSRESQLVLREKGHRVISSFDEVQEESLDIITAFDVVEHLYDIPNFLETCKRKLKKEGLVIMLTGNVSSMMAKIAKHNWWYVRFPEHIMFPSKCFFEGVDGFKLINWMPTYASPDFTGEFLLGIKVLIKGLLKGNYCGHPPLSPDHSLIILKLQS